MICLSLGRSMFPVDWHVEGDALGTWWMKAAQAQACGSATWIRVHHHQLYFSHCNNKIITFLVLSQGRKVQNSYCYSLGNSRIWTSVDESVVLSRFVIHRYAVTDANVPRNGYSLKLKQKLWQKCRGNGHWTVACTLFNWLGSNVGLMAIVPQQNNLLTERPQ